MGVAVEASGVVGRSRVRAVSLLPLCTRGVDDCWPTQRFFSATQRQTYFVAFAKV